MNHDDDPIPSDLVGLLADLPRELEPERDLWDGVRTEIEPVAVQGANRPMTAGAWAIAGVAVLAAVALVSALVTARTLQRPAPPAPTTAVAPVEAVDQWESDVRQTTDDLMAVLDSRREGLDPEAMQVIEVALADIDAAIEDVRRALRDDPENDGLEAALAGVYQRKVHLLRSATDLPAGG